jgi:hypothetical protein
MFHSSHPLRVQIMKFLIKSPLHPPVTSSALCYVPPVQRDGTSHTHIKERMQLQFYMIMFTISDRILGEKVILTER